MNKNTFDIDCLISDFDILRSNAEDILGEDFDLSQAQEDNLEDALNSIENLLCTLNETPNDKINNNLLISIMEENDVPPIKILLEVFDGGNECKILPNL